MKKTILLIVCLICLFSFCVVNAGNNPPTSNTTLPYKSSRMRIYNYTYTAKKFHPTYAGKLFMCFSGLCSASSPATTVTIKIMHQTDNGVQWSTGISGYDFPKIPQKALYGLNTSEYFYGYVSKNNPSIYMDFVMKFGTSQSEASNYTF